MLNVRQLKRLSIGPIDLTLKAGAITALVGPSGAGKSLLLRAIADLDLNDGEASVDGISRTSLPAPDWRRQVMYVPAHSGWWADLVEPHFEGTSRSRVVELLHHLGLESTALTWQVANLSTGERQRLSLARAFAHDPKVLLLDEPTSGLDAENAARVEALIRKHASAGKSILFVTHDATQAARLGGQVLHLEGGKLSEVVS